MDASTWTLKTQLTALQMVKAAIQSDGAVLHELMEEVTPEVVMALASIAASVAEGIHGGEDGALELVSVWTAEAMRQAVQGE